MNDQTNTHRQAMLKSIRDYYVLLYPGPGSYTREEWTGQVEMAVADFDNHLDNLMYDSFITLDQVIEEENGEMIEEDDE